MFLADFASCCFVIPGSVRRACAVSRCGRTVYNAVVRSRHIAVLMTGGPAHVALCALAAMVAPPTRASDLRAQRVPAPKLYAAQRRALPRPGRCCVAVVARASCQPRAQGVYNALCDPAVHLPR